MGKLIYIFSTCNAYKNPESQRTVFATTDKRKLINALKQAIEDGVIDYYYADEDSLPDGQATSMMTAKLDETLSIYKDEAKLNYALNGNLKGGVVEVYEDGEMFW